MSHIFKSLCQDETDARKFGICDDKPHQRAYIDTEDGRKWIAVIQNDERKSITFTAFDNCIEFNKTNGKKESRCEGVLTYSDTIIFVEAKERKGDAQTWAKDADKQLRNSIKLIEAKINLNIFSIKKAAICNKLQKGLINKHSVRMKQFLDETGYVLIISKRLSIE
jgi:hypothetical protein